MRSYFEVQRLDVKGNPIPNTKNQRAAINANYGFWDFVLDNWSDTLTFVWDSIQWGSKVISGQWKDALEDLYRFAEASIGVITDGADRTYAATGTENYISTIDRQGETLDILYRATSDDELAIAKCRTVFAPPQAVLVKERMVGAQTFEAHWQLPIRDLRDGMYSFIAGAQEDGSWLEDFALINTLLITIIKDPALIALEWQQHVDEKIDPPLPPHHAPNVPVSAEIAARYALLSTQLAGFGVDLGGPGANSYDGDGHYCWAIQQTVPRIEEEMVRKIRHLVRASEQYFYGRDDPILGQVQAKGYKTLDNVYAMLSAELAKMETFADVPGLGPEHDSREPSDHYKWIDAGIEPQRGLRGVRNTLLKKIFVVFETPLTVHVPPAPSKLENIAADLLPLARQLNAPGNQRLIHHLEEILAQQGHPGIQPQPGVAALKPPLDPAAIVIPPPNLELAIGAGGDRNGVRDLSYLAVVPGVFMSRQEPYE
jgi:hypothetical protein